MKIVGKVGRDDIATVYIAEIREGLFIEFVESVQPPLPREEKWVLIVSTLLGCPVGCPMCDAGGWYKGKLSKEEIMAQIDYMVKRRFPDKRIPSKKFKIQFARMGEPSFNPYVLEVLEELPVIYDAPGLIPSISTIAPIGTNGFFERLLEIKRKHYTEGKFQLQFSIHTTNAELRDKLIPLRKWDFPKIAEYGERFYESGDRKITLNFALAKSAPLEPEIMEEYFDPAVFLIKITPVNPTLMAIENKIDSYIDIESLEESRLEIVEQLRAHKYDVIVSIGELEENRIGSNCGQYVRRFLENGQKIKGSYEYRVRSEM
jgi:23S rRNA (adenine2503-C2)-methyltransferase